MPFVPYRIPRFYQHLHIPVSSHGTNNEHFMHYHSSEARDKCSSMVLDIQKSLLSQLSYHGAHPSLSKNASIQCVIQSQQGGHLVFRDNPTTHILLM